MLYAIFALGVFIGFLVAALVSTCYRAAGILKIDHSDPEKDQYLFEIGDLDGLSKKTKIVLKIDNKADLSQK